MEDLINSMVRFSAAMTLFGVQQLQNAMGAMTDSQTALNKFRASLDSVTNAINGQIDDANKRTLDSVSRFGTDLVDSMNVRAFDPREMVEATTSIMRRTTDSFADLVKKTNEPKHSAGEPQPVAEALKAKSSKSA